MTAIAALPFLPEAVIFDMDGLMIDSERVSLACWSQAARELALPFTDDFWLGMVGLGDRDCEQGLPLRPGIVEILQLLQAHGIPRAVATSTRQPRASRKLAATGLLAYFDHVVTSSDVAHPKPAPDIYLLAAQKLGKDPARCLALEDSPAGIRAAVGAGMTAIQVPDLVHPDADLRALGHRIVESLADAHALLLPLLQSDGRAEG